MRTIKRTLPTTDFMDQSFAIIAERFRPALDLLVTAFDYAEDSRSDRWQLAVGLTELQASGATLADVRWLILRGFAEHARETTIPGDSERSFRKLAATAFPVDTYLALSAFGAATLKQALYSAKQAIAAKARQPSGAPAGDPHVPADAHATPEWDAARRELRYQGRVIKRYRVPARNQALILSAFQESGWPDFIDDPLPPTVDQDSKARLQATIKSLNRSQLAHIIRFHGNGNGQQVYWESVPPADKHRLGSGGR
jgi:hypothetical protein